VGVWQVDWRALRVTYFQSRLSCDHDFDQSPSLRSTEREFDGGSVGIPWREAGPLEVEVNTLLAGSVAKWEDIIYPGVLGDEIVDMGSLKS
jgi:hypothetical protein